MSGIRWDILRLAVFLTFGIKDAVQAALAVQSGSLAEYTLRLALAVSFFGLVVREAEAVAGRGRP